MPGSLFLLYPVMACRSGEQLTLGDLSFHFFIFIISSRPAWEEASGPLNDPIAGHQGNKDKLPSK